MHILIVNNSKIPVFDYGGTERVIWYLGKELVKLGHQVSYLVETGSFCDFASVYFIDSTRSLNDQIPPTVDLVHLNFALEEQIDKPYLITMHGNCNDDRKLDQNTVFVSENHAHRFGSTSFVHNGLDWKDYGKVDTKSKRSYFHFLGNAAWRVKNVQGAIDVIKATPKERLEVMGGKRFNVSMGVRFTFHPRIKFKGMVGGAEKNALLSQSKGLVFPVKWHEPFGLALIESLYFGCPVFGTPYGSLPELIIPSVGLLSDKADDLTLAVLSADQYSKTTCHEYAADCFNSLVMAQRYIKKYELVLNGEKLNDKKPQLIEIQKVKFLHWEK
jgi:glycosyltransferase involved in cell wall biosynthesis